MSDQYEDYQEGMVEQVHEKYDIPDSNFKPEISEQFNDVHSKIEQINSILVNLFKKKEQDLLDEYKKQMTQAQQQEKTLHESTSEAELKKRMIEKKEKLQKERQKFLETSIYFSNKCKSFKETLTKVVNTTKDLESEIQFLNEQIVYAEKHNTKLKGELEEIKQKVKKYEPDANFDDIDKILTLPNKNKMQKDMSIIKSQNDNNIKNGQTQQQVSQSQDNILPIQRSSLGQQKAFDKYVSPYSKQVMHKFEVEPQDIVKAKEELRKQKEIYEKLNEFLNDQCFQETEFEKIFLESVMTVKKRKNNNTQNNSISHQKLPQISNLNATNESSIINKRGNESTLDYTQLSDFDFNDFGKRQILEEFLSREEIKRYLYSLIFGQQQQQQLMAATQSGVSGANNTNMSQLQEGVNQSSNRQ